MEKVISTERACELLGLSYRIKNKSKINSRALDKLKDYRVNGLIKKWQQGKPYKYYESEIVKLRDLIFSGQVNG